MAVHDFGIDDMVADLQREVSASGTYVVEHANDSDAAVFLQARDGYLVYNDTEVADRHTDALGSLAASPQPLTRAAVIESQKRAARDVVGFHRAYAGGTKPPLRKGGPSRPVRAGAWADRRGVTANSYEAFVEGERVENLPGPEGQDLR